MPLIASGILPEAYDLSWASQTIFGIEVPTINALDWKIQGDHNSRPEDRNEKREVGLSFPRKRESRGGMNEPNVLLIMLGFALLNPAYELEKNIDKNRKRTFTSFLNKKLFGPQGSEPVRCWKPYNGKNYLQKH